MKTNILLVIAILISICFTSCNIKVIKDQTTVKAKLKCIDNPMPSKSPIQIGDLLIRNIDRIYNIGENIKVDGLKYEIIYIEDPADYTLEMVDDSLYIFDAYNDRVVGAVYLDSLTPLGKLLIDNNL